MAHAELNQNVQGPHFLDPKLWGGGVLTGMGAPVRAVRRSVCTRDSGITFGPHGLLGRKRISETQPRAHPRGIPCMGWRGLFTFGPKCPNLRVLALDSIIKKSICRAPNSS